MSFRKFLKIGLEYAAKDYNRISALMGYDVKPKEDQVKCCIYRALSEAGYVVHVEASSVRNGARCDLIAIDPKGACRTAIEIKTAWAGAGWVNKPAEQAKSWLEDIDKLKALKKAGYVNAGLLIICFAYERDSDAQWAIRQRIDLLGGEFLPTFELNNWNGLNEAQFFIVDAFAG